MFATLIIAALFIAPAIRGVFADFTMPTPDLTQCQNVHITWDPTKGPYNVFAVSSDDFCNDLADLGTHSGSSITWKVTLPAGTKIVLTVEDSQGDEAWSNDIVVGTGTDDSCLSAADLAALKNATLTPSTSNNATTTLSVLPSPSPSTSPLGNTSAGAINNAGNTPSSGAFTIRQVSHPVLAMCAFIGALTLAL